MRERVCKKHGILSPDDVYVHRRKTRLDYECKRCVLAHQAQRLPKVLGRRRERRSTMDPELRETVNERRREKYSTDPTRYVEYQAQLRRTAKLEALVHYGGDPPSCRHCGEDDVRFLALDHVNEDGKEHRKTFSGSASVWARRNGFPPIFQILCHNCNHLKSFRAGASKSVKSLRNLKYEVLSRYGGDEIRCALCPMSDARVLTIDHVDGGGNEHRRRIGVSGSARFYRWLKHQGFPVGYRVLCFNHNVGKHCLGD